MSKQRIGKGRQMNPADFEWAQEQAEIAYERGQINAIEFLRRMRAMGFKDETSWEFLHDIDERKEGRYILSRSEHLA